MKIKVEFNVQGVLYSFSDEDDDGVFLKVVQLFSRALFIENQE